MIYVAIRDHGYEGLAPPDGAFSSLEAAVEYMAENSPSNDFDWVVSGLVVDDVGAEDEIFLCFPTDHDGGLAAKSKNKHFYPPVMFVRLPPERWDTLPETWTAFEKRGQGI